MEASASAHEVAQQPPARSGSGRLAMLFLGSVVALYVAIAYTLYALVVAVA